MARKLGGFDAEAVSHIGETCMDWQYGLTYRFALASEPHLTDKPAGGRWIPNRYVANSGRELVVPAWSDGSVVVQRAYWRRPKPGMRSWDPAHLVRENARPWWSGPQIPARLLEELVGPLREEALALLEARGGVTDGLPVDNSSQGGSDSCRLI